MKSAERYDQEKIKTNNRKKTIVTSHDFPVKSDRIVGVLTGRLLGSA